MSLIDKRSKFIKVLKTNIVIYSLSREPVLNQVRHSHDVPLSSVLVGAEYLMGLPPNLRVFVTIKDLKAFNDFVFDVRRRSVTHVVQDLEPNVFVFVVG